MSFKPSKYQTAVYQHVTDGTGNAVIDAVAGSGKSTTIVEALKLIPKNLKVLFLAFNKAIVEELKIKIGQLDNVEIKTLHSLGMSAITRAFKGVRVDGAKYRTYVNNAIKYGGIKPIEKLEWEELGNYKLNVLALVDLYRVNLCEGAEHLLEVGRKHMIFPMDNEAEMAMRVVEWGKTELNTIDFTDMIYFPNVMKLKMPQFDFTFIDECQDLNTAQREMFLQCIGKYGQNNWSNPDGRFVAVGDPRQAIYGFAGADVESFNTLKNLPNTISLPLSVCYRCDETIILKAKEIVPQIEAKEGAELGTVEDCKVEDIQDGDMVLCRVTAPLVALCMHYIGNSIKAYVKGRDIGQNLINMINKTKCRYLNDTLSKMDRDLSKVADKIVKRTGCTLSEAKEDSQFTSMEDKIQAIKVIAKDLKTTDAVVNRITTIFKDDQKDGICLSTIHKAKGLESNRVFIIRPDKLFLPHCMRVAWMAEQEYNLAYVAYTRAKKYLGFVQDFQADQMQD